MTVRVRVEVERVGLSLNFEHSLIAVIYSYKFTKKSFFDDEAHSRAPRSGHVPPEPSQRTPARS